MTCGLDSKHTCRPVSCLVLAFTCAELASFFFIVSATCQVVDRLQRAGLMGTSNTAPSPAAAGAAEGTPAADSLMLDLEGRLDEAGGFSWWQFLR